MLSHDMYAMPYPHPLRMQRFQKAAIGSRHDSIVPFNPRFIANLLQIWVVCHDEYESYLCRESAFLQKPAFRLLVIMNNIESWTCFNIGSLLLLLECDRPGG
jgi:hypothetical protein